MTDDGLISALLAGIKGAPEGVRACEYCAADVAPEVDEFGLVLHIKHDDDCPFYLGISNRAARRKGKK